MRERIGISEGRHIRLDELVDKRQIVTPPEPIDFSLEKLDYTACEMKVDYDTSPRNVISEDFQSRSGNRTSFRIYHHAEFRILKIATIFYPFRIVKLKLGSISSFIPPFLPRQFERLTEIY